MINNPSSADVVWPTYIIHMLYKRGRWRTGDPWPHQRLTVYWNTLLIHKTRQTHVSAGEESLDALRLTGVHSTTMKVFQVAFGLGFAIQAAMGLHCDSGCSACWKDNDSSGTDIKIACGADNRWECTTGCPTGYSDQHCAENERCRFVKWTLVSLRLTKRPLAAMIHVINSVLVCVELRQMLIINGVFFAEALRFVMFLCKYQVSA